MEFDKTAQFTEDLTLGRMWLRQMGNAASKNGMTVQYCMSPSRHALQSLEIPSVTQVHVSKPRIVLFKSLSLAMFWGFISGSRVG